MPRPLVLVLLVAAVVATAARPALARSLRVEAFEADIVVHADGTVDVTERIRVGFEGSWNGIFRWIPYGYTYPSGLRGQIELRLDAVEDDAGRPLEHWTHRSGGRLEVKVRVPGASDAVRTVLLRYRALDVVRLQKESEEDFGAYDELYWNVTGNDWVAPIEHVSATVRLPEAVPAERVRAGGFTGTYGARGGAWRVERQSGTALLFTTTEPLLPGAGLTIAVTFPPGHVAKPDLLQRARWWARANGTSLLPLAFLALWLVLWALRGRDALGSRTIVPDWRPPDDLGPAEVGVLADDRLDARDLTAAIVGLAVRGVLTIAEEEDDWRLDLAAGARTRGDLPLFERRVVGALFGPDGDTVRLGDLKHALYARMDGLRGALLDGLVSKGHYGARPDRVTSRWFGVTLVVVMVLAFLPAVLDVTWLYVVALVVSAVGMIVVARWMPRRTRKGLDALARIRGLEEYIRTAERHRLEAAPADHFDRVLPFALALGLHDRWAAAFADLYTADPAWYRSREATAGSRTFVRRLGRFDRSLATTALAAPRSTNAGTGGRSWGGGWSGGGGISSGSSGGGFGGGGGGGW